MLETDLHPYESLASSGKAKTNTDLLKTNKKLSVDGPLDPLDANKPIQEVELHKVHDQELRCCAQYDKANGTPDDLYIAPTDHNSGSGSINNFSAFS
jgi:hypothetical protein